MLVLASASPRRRALLKEAGIPFTVVVPDVVETTGPEPHAVAVDNARRKALAVPGDLVLGADTVVATRDGLLGKPCDPKEARNFVQVSRC